MARITLPAIKQPTNTNDLVGFNLQNATAAAIPSQYITFQQTFLPGKVSVTDSLAANGLPAQMDVKTTNSDGSVRSTLITFKHPALPANSMTQFMLTKGGPALTGNPQTFVGINLQVKAGANTFDASAMFAGGPISYWQRGPLATQGRVSASVSGSLRVTIDLTVYADSTTSVDVQFNNDAAMQASGGAQSYMAVITRNGVQVLSQAVTHYQYQTWHKVIGGSPANVVLDIAYLIKTGAIPCLDLAAGADSAALAGLSTSNTILGSGSVAKYMPTTGTRPDIGPMPSWCAIWLLTQDPKAAQSSLVQADVAGSVPWHFFDPKKGSYLSLDDYPTLWIDPRGNPTLTQGVSGSGWTTDSAHQPDLSYVPYLLTGRRYYLDQLNAQATFGEFNTWPSPRQNGLGLVGNGQDEVRAQAWNLRNIDNAAWANPTGSPEQIRFAKLANNNWSSLASKTAAWTTQQGAPHGWVPGDYRDGMAPWQQDYFASTTIQAVRLGVASAALTFLNWQMNFLVGRFLNAANGFPPQGGASYSLHVGGTTWASLGGSASWGDTNYAALAAGTLAGIITVTGSADAKKAYDWLMASSAPYIHPYFSEPQLGIVPSSSVSPPPPPPPPPPPTGTAVTVGPGKQYASIAAAVSAAKVGDTIDVDAGTYTNNFAIINKALTIRGVGGLAKLIATVPCPNGKGIFTTQANVTLQSLEFVGAKVPDLNGAGVRHEAGNLTLDQCFFHDNQDGVLVSAIPGCVVAITNSEFARNGVDGDGHTHNIYVNKIASLTIDNCYFHEANIGNQVKSRADATTVKNSRIFDLQATASYSIDMPNGGVAVIRNNTIQQGPNSGNPSIIAFSAEATPYPGSSLLIDGNTVINDQTSRAPWLLNNFSTIAATVTGSRVWGITSAQIANGPASVTGTTTLSSKPTLDTSSPFGTTPPPPPNPATLSIAAVSSSKPEGLSGPSVFAFAVTRAGNTTIAASANWSVTGSGINPASASDFTGNVLPSGTVSFAAGETSKTISVSVNGDSIVEPNEGFTVTLSSPSANTTISGGSAGGTISNDDATSPPPSSRMVVVIGDNSSVTVNDSNITISVDGVRVWPS